VGAGRASRTEGIWDLNAEVFAVIVTYYPDGAHLAALCEVLSACAQIVIVDNTPARDETSVPAHACSLRMGENAGISAAQNVGIAEARRQGAEAIVFFDQDSSPDAALLPMLIGTSRAHPGMVIAPVCVDSRSGAEYPSFRFTRRGRAVPVTALGEVRPIQVDLIISSGCLVPVDVFHRAGVMNEDLFIDFVDIEWCIRCRKAGIAIIVQPQATMRHSIGSKVVPGALFTTFVHSPVRSYYRLRNALLLLRMEHVPRLYAWHEVVGALVHHALQWRHSHDRRQHVRMGWQALIDGARGVKGRMRSSEACNTEDRKR
jgi:rhamnosyltransferase